MVNSVVNAGFGMVVSATASNELADGHGFIEVKDFKTGLAVDKNTGAPVCAQAEMQLLVKDDSGNSRVIRENLRMLPDLAWLHLAFLRCVGVIANDAEGDVALTEELYHAAVGKTGEVIIGHHDWTGRDGRTHRSTDIKKYLPKKQAQAAPQTTQMPTMAIKGGEDPEDEALNQLSALMDDPNETY